MKKIILSALLIFISTNTAMATCSKMLGSSWSSQEQKDRYNACLGGAGLVINAEMSVKDAIDTCKNIYEIEDTTIIKLHESGAINELNIEKVSIAKKVLVGSCATGAINSESNRHHLK